MIFFADLLSSDFAGQRLVGFIHKLYTPDALKVQVLL